MNSELHDDPIQPRRKRWWEWIAPVSGMGGFVREFWAFLWERKLWWLTPIVFFLIVLSVILIFAQGSVIAPLIYPIF